MKNLKQNSILSLAVLSALSLSACNIEIGLDQASADLVNKTSTGVITSLQDLQVNGVTYDTNNAQILSDGQQADTSDLKKGMVVSITGTESQDGTGKATIIEYEDVTEGEVLSNTASIDNTLDVMGQTVHVDNSTVFESNDDSVNTMDDINPGSIIEVSGHSSGNGEIWATRVEMKKAEMELGDVVEVKGNIQNLTETAFDIGNLTVNYENARLDADFNGQLNENMYVEATSLQSLNDVNYMLADFVELKSHGEIEVKHSNNDQEVEVKGLITDVLSNTEIKINGASVILNSQTRLENGIAAQLIAGSMVEAEGYIDSNGDFQATKIEFENDSNSSNDDDRDSDNSSNDDDRDSDNSSNDDDRDSDNSSNDDDRDSDNSSSDDDRDSDNSSNDDDRGSDNSSNDDDRDTDNSSNDDDRGSDNSSNDDDQDSDSDDLDSEDDHDDDSNDVRDESRNNELNDND